MIFISIKENFRFWFRLTLAFYLIQTITRTILLLENIPPIIEILKIYADGFLWDTVLWGLLSIPFLAGAYLIKLDRHKKFSGSKIKLIILTLFIFILSFIGFCEITFWNEFHSRFNFIAVDYLIYTNEVLANIMESYPMVPILIGLAIFSAVMTYLFTRIKFKEWSRPAFFQPMMVFVLLGIVLPCALTFGVEPWLEYHDENFHDDQLSRNGVIEFVRAFRSNKIDYKSFYPTLSDEAVHKIQGQSPLPNPALNLNHPLNKPNVVVIVVESLGAKFIEPLGGFKNITPNLNQLSSDSIFFENFYATGTRTVRGLEAINLSVPPTPGYAVVKRPNHKNLYSMGNTFKNNGYDPIFLYGGNGFFDNMNSFFSGNGFQVVDEDHFESKEISFKNAWGVCDEDLFNKALSILDKRQGNSPFLLFMLTTSNHRPFTYPEGKIDIPSGTSRAGAVKYTDFAIGDFLRKSQNHKWAKNTVFVIVADHSTEGRGRFDLEMTDFHIPLWIYSPHFIQPQKISRLSSQIDLLPTMIHLLNLKDNSPFFGKSILNTNWKEERAFIGNYQFVGFYKDKLLTTLGPNKIVRNFSFDPTSKRQEATDQEGATNEAISYYQLASEMLDTGAFNLTRTK